MQKNIQRSAHVAGGNGSAAKPSAFFGAGSEYSGFRLPEGFELNPHPNLRGQFVTGSWTDNGQEVVR